MAKIEKSDVAKFEKAQKIRRINNVIEYNRSKIAEVIELKQEKIAEFQKEKNLILEESKKKRKIIAVEKSYIENVYDSVLNKGDINVSR